MVRFGFTSKGTQRWRCMSCGVSGIRIRPDNHLRIWRARLALWLTNPETLTTQSKRWHINRRTSHRAFTSLWKEELHAPLLSLEDKALVLDATALAPDLVALIARTPDDGGLSFEFAEQESYESWKHLLSRLADTPRAVVSDAQKGLKKAIRERFPGVPIQRCLMHVMRLALAWITKRPQTAAGKTLRVLVKAMSHVWSEYEARVWTTWFLRWCIHYQCFLAERTMGADGCTSWWTHRKLRQTSSLLRRSIPELFTYTVFPGIPRTTNHVEGGINAGIAEVISRHRGLTSAQKKTAVALFLNKRQMKKSTRNVS